MKILTLCYTGTVRSVCMAYILKHRNQDALAGSLKWNSDKTLLMLFNWADKILLMDNEHLDQIPPKYIHKLVITHVGRDIWFNSLHPDLLEICNDLAIKNGL